MCIHTYLMYTYITHHKLIKVKLQHNTMRKIIKKIRQHIHTLLLWRQITSISIVCSAVCTGTDQRKHQSSASLAFVRGIHRWPVDSPHREPVTRKMFPFDDVIMNHDIPRAPQQYLYHFYTWWRHQMETFSALLAICAGNSPVPGEFPTQRPVRRGFVVFFDQRPNKRLSKQSWGWWFETHSPPLCRHSNETRHNGTEMWWGL